MCTIISKNQLIGKNYDSAVPTGMLFTNKRGLIKNSAVFPPDRPLEWVSVYGSITFSQSGKEMPVSGINEEGFVAEQATLLSAAYPEPKGKPAASCLEATQYLLDTCSNVEQALEALDRIEITKTSWPIHFALFDRNGQRAVVEYLQGEKKVFRSETSESIVVDNTEYINQSCRMELKTVEDVVSNLAELYAKTTVWSNIYDLQEMKLYLKSAEASNWSVFALDQFDFSPGGENRMLNIRENNGEFIHYKEEANHELVSDFFRHPAISQIIYVPDSEGLIEFIADQAKIYDRTNEIVLRFLEEEKICQLPVKATHKLYVLKYLASKFETGKEYSEGQVNSIIDDWHTFGDYFVLRRELIDSGLMKRLPNGSKYWRE